MKIQLIRSLCERILFSILHKICILLTSTYIYIYISVACRESCWVLFSSLPPPFVSSDPFFCLFSFKNMSSLHPLSLPGTIFPSGVLFSSYILLSHKALSYRAPYFSVFLRCVLLLCALILL